MEIGLTIGIHRPLCEMALRFTNGCHKLSLQMFLLQPLRMIGLTSLVHTILNMKWR